MQTFKGSCHCGKIAFEFPHPVLDDKMPVVSCGCSICRKNGHLMIYVPQDKFTFTNGGADTSAYTFNNKVLTHHFCPECGSSVGGFGMGVFASNVRMLEGVDLQKLTLMSMNWE